MIKRHVTAIIALVACTSCLPQAEHPRALAQGGGAVPRPTNDHQLLRMLALADPLGQPAPVVTPGRPSRIPAPPFEIRNVDLGDAERATECLTAAVYYEARSESLDGQRAVAQVVLNRVRDRAFPNSVCKVVYQRPVHGTGCQFSFACDGSTQRPLDRRAWATARGIALAALNGSVFAPIGSATYYHTAAVLPWWAASLNRIGSIGSHIFYRWRDGLGRALSFRQPYSGVEASPGPLMAERSPLVPTGSSPALAASYTDTDVENGVAIHRSTAVRAVAATPVRLSFGVRVHYGMAADPIEPPASTSAADKGEGEAALAS